MKYILNITDLSKKINVPVSTLRYWLKQGKCPIQPIDNFDPPKWNLSDVNRFIDGQ